jgi:hypothetical protein
MEINLSCIGNGNHLDEPLQAKEIRANIEVLDKL